MSAPRSMLKRALRRLAAGLLLLAASPSSAEFMAANVNDRAHQTNSEVTTGLTGTLTLRSNTLEMEIATKSTADVLKDNEILFAELYEQSECVIGSGKSTCIVACFPYTVLGDGNHIRAHECNSWPNRPTMDIDVNTEVANWVVGTVTPINGAAGTYKASFQYKAEVKGSYMSQVYLATEQGIKAEYWDNIWFVDAPVKTVTETEINFQWGTGAITTYGIDYVSARYTAKLKPDYTELFTFYLKADDGARLWIDKNLVIDSWDRCCNETFADVNLDKDTYHDFFLEYKDVREDAYLELRWSSWSIAKTIVPQKQFYRYEAITCASCAGAHSIGPGPAATTYTQVIDTANFGVDANGVGMTTAGTANSVQVQVRDAFGNTVDTDISASFDQATLTATMAGDATVTWYGGDGQFTHTDAVVYPGTFTVQWATTGKTYVGTNDFLPVKLQAPAEDFNGASPWHIIDSPFALVVDPAPTSPPTSVIDPVQLVDGIAGVQNHFTLTAKDEYGNKRESASPDLIRIRFEDGSGGNDDATSGHGTCLFATQPTGQAPGDPNEGLYNCEYTLTKVGTYQPHIVFITGDPEVEHPIRGVTLDTIDIAPGELHAPSSVQSGIPTVLIEAGTQNTFTVEARDEFDNTKTDADLANTEWEVTMTKTDGTATVEATCEYLKNDGSTTPQTASCLAVTCVSCNGVFTVTWYPEIQGTYTFNIRARTIGTPSWVAIKDNPWTVTVKPSAVSPPNSVFVSGTGHLYGTTDLETSFVIQTRDRFNNNLWSSAENQLMTLTNPNSGAAAVTDFFEANIECGSATLTHHTIHFAVTHVADSEGLYTMTYTPRVADAACALRIALGGSPGLDINGSPRNLAVVTGIINAEYTQIVLPSYVPTPTWNPNHFPDPLIKGGVAGQWNSFYIQPQDHSENNIPKHANAADYFSFIVSVHDDGPTAAPSFSGTAAVEADGRYKVEYKTDVANTYDRIQIELHNVGALRGNYFTDYEFTNLLASGTDKLNSEINFDWDYGEPLAGQSSDYFTVKWEGMMQVLYTETYTFYFKLYAGSGAKLTIDGNEVINVWDPQSGSTEPWGQVQLTAATLYPILVEFREKEGRAKIILEWESVSQAREVVPSTAFFYTKNIGGTAYNGQVKIIPAPTHAETSEVTGDGLVNMVAGTAETLSITAKDVFGNLQTDAGDESDLFKIHATHEAGQNFTFNCSAVTPGAPDGLYQGTFNATAEGFHTVEVLYGPEGNRSAVSGQVYKIWVYPAAVDGTYTEATLTEGIAGEEYTFQLHIKDQFGNYRNKTGDEAPSSDYTVDFMLQHTNFEDDYLAQITSSALTDTKGIWTISYIATKTGFYTPVIYVDGENVNTINVINDVATTPVTTLNHDIKMNEAKAKASNSYLITVPVAAGTTDVAQTIEVQLVDRFGNLLEITGSNDAWDYQFVVLVDDNDGFVDRGSLKAGTAEANGKVQIAFTPVHAGEYTLSVMLCESAFPTNLGSGAAHYPAARGAPDGLTGEYFTNRWLMNDPVITRIDDEMEFNWDTGLITDTAQDYVSIRWSGYIQFNHAELHTFSLTVDDGASLYVNGTRVINDFKSVAGTYEGSWTPAVTNLPYSIRVEYRENTDSASFKMEWQSDNTVKAVVPTANLFSGAGHISGSPFTFTVNDPAP